MQRSAAATSGTGQLLILAQAAIERLGPDSSQNLADRIRHVRKMRCMRRMEKSAGGKGEEGGDRPRGERVSCVRLYAHHNCDLARAQLCMMRARPSRKAKASIRSNKSRHSSPIHDYVRFACSTPLAWRNSAGMSAGLDSFSANRLMYTSAVRYCA